MPKKAKEADKSKSSQQKSVSEASNSKEDEAHRLEKTESRLQDKAYLDRGLDNKKLKKRVQYLMSYFKQREQHDETNNDEVSIDIIAAQLIQPHLIENSEKEVRLFVACCLADIFRIYAPDIPYDDDQLQSIFKLFINELSGLEKGPNSTVYARTFYLLTRLVEVKAFVLISDDEDLLLHLFNTLFEIIYALRAVASSTPAVTAHITDVLLVSLEDTQVPSQILDELFDFFIFKGRESTAVSSFVTNLLIKGAEKFQGSITKYLNDLLDQHSDSEVRERCHQIIFSVNRVSSNLLLYVMPHLENQLVIEHEEVRSERVDLLSRMFSHTNSTLHTTYRKLFEAFLKRFSDKNPQIRETMLEFATHYFANNHNDQAADISTLLAQRLRDPDENVRQKAVGTVCTIIAGRPDILTNLPVDELFMRMRDRKQSIRKEVTQKLGAIYQALHIKHGSSFEWPSSLRKKYALIPSKIIQNYPVPGEELRVDTIMDECLLSKPKQNVEHKTNMLVEVIEILLQDGIQKDGTSPGFSAFSRLLKEKKAFQVEFNKYLKMRKKKDVDDDALDRQLRTLAQLVPVPTADKSLEHFTKLHAHQDKKTFAALGVLADINSTFAQQATAKSELLQWVGKKSPQYEHNLAIAQKLRHTACSKESIPFLMEKLSEEVEDANNDSRPILKLVELLSFNYPEFFDEYFQELSDLLKNTEVLNRAVVILANIGANFNIPAAAGKSVTKKLTTILTDGTPYQARYAVRALKSLFPSTVFTPILKEIVDKLSEHSKLGSALTALAQMAKIAPDQFKPHAKTVITFVVDEIFSGNVTGPSVKATKKGNNKSPNSKSRLSGDLKGFGAKVLSAYLVGLHASEETVKDETAKKYLGLIVGVIENGRETIDDERDELRRVDSVVSASAALLRIAGIRRYEHVFTPQQFETLAWVARDKSSSIRNGFASKLFAAVKDVKLHVKYLAIPPLFVMDSHNATTAKGALNIGIKARRAVIKNSSEELQEKDKQARLAEIFPEYALPYLIHLIAHCPDFKTDGPEYLHTSRYLSFFANEILHEEEHLSFLILLLEGLKVTKDKINPSSTNFLVVDEIAILIMNEKSQTRNWKSGKHPGGLLLPSTLFAVPDKASAVAPKKQLAHGWKLPDQSKKLLLGLAQPTTAASAAATSAKAQEGNDKAEKGDKTDKAEKAKSSSKAAAKPKSTPKRRLVYDKDDEEVLKKRKGAGTSTSTSSSSSSSTAALPKSPHSLRPRSIKSYFEKIASDDEKEEESEESEEETKTKKATPPRKAKTPPKKGKAKKVEEEEEDVEEEEEEKPKKGKAAKKGKEKVTEEEEEEDKEEEEEEEEEVKPKGRGKKAAAKKKKDEEEEESESDTEKTKKKKGKATTTKTKESPQTKNTRSKRKKDEEEEEEEESDAELVDKRRTKKTK